MALAVVALVGLRAGSCLRVDRPYKPLSAKQLVAALSARANAVRSVRAETRMAHQTNQGKVKATVRLMAERGGKLRFDAVSPFDTPLSTLVANGSDFALVDAKSNRHYYGPASPCNLARLLRVRLRPDDVLTLLGGFTPMIAHERAELRWDERAGAEVLTLHGSNRKQVIRLQGSSANGRVRWDLLSSEISDAAGMVLLRITAKDHHTVKSLRVPRVISVEQPVYKTSLDVAFKKHEINLALPEVAFKLPSAGGMPSQRVDCATRLSTTKAPEKKTK
ncbi:MAG: DUF4292 domain-containing protein [Myxococcales bacterium]|nr:DUF4292 domain-containing protein [Myxococcales bacterium]